MSYSIGSSSDSGYEGTTCLINKLGIRDENLLAETESAYTLAKASYLELNPLLGEFDFEHYKNIHRFLFCDLYDWAGELRGTDLSKKGTVFVAADSIQECAEACFARVKGLNFSEMEHLELAEELADFYSTLNMIHPFREGNGRAQRVFFAQWVRHLGYDIDFSDVDPDELMIATIQAAQGVLDHLTALFSEHLTPTQTMDIQQIF